MKCWPFAGWHFRNDNYSSSSYIIHWHWNGTGSYNYTIWKPGTDDLHIISMRHNGHGSVSNHQPHDCLLNRLFRRRSKKTPKLCITGLCVGSSPVIRSDDDRFVQNNVGGCCDVENISEITLILCQNELIQNYTQTAKESDTAVLWVKFRTNNKTIRYRQLKFCEVWVEKVFSPGCILQHHLVLHGKY